MEIGSIRRHLKWAVSLILITISLAQALYWPVNTVMQISLGVSWPIDVPDRKVFITQAFQVNYNLPWSVKQSYRPPFLPYARALDSVPGLGTSLLELMFHPTHSMSENSSSPSNASSSFLDSGNDAVRTARRQPRSVESVKQPDTLSVETKYNGELLNVGKFDKDENRHKVDMSAGELYRTIEQSLEDSGFEASCLLKSVCELARHPLHLPPGEENFLGEILHFVMTPSAHQSFMPHEEHHRTQYEAAEEAGRNGADCVQIYHECSSSLLDYFTSFENHPHNTDESDTINNINSLNWVGFYLVVL